MIDKFRRRFAFDAENAAVGVIIIGIESNDSAIFDGGNSGAMRGAKRAVAPHGVRWRSVVSHG